MSVRKKNTQGRKTLIRECGTCGAMFLTSAQSPWIRQVTRDGKRQATTYYCCQTCYKASYKHLFDGKAEERRREKESNRDNAARNRRYYQAHAEEIKAKKREQYWADPEKYREINLYNKRMRRARACEG